MILEIGSGQHPLESRGVLHLDLEKGAQADIIADAHHLPFRDQSFSWIYASNVLEHLEHPLTALREMSRVSRQLFLRIPFLNEWSLLSCQDSENKHLYTWNFYSIRNLLKLASYRALTFSIYPVESRNKLKMILLRILKVRRNDELWIKASK